MSCGNGNRKRKPHSIYFVRQAPLDLGEQDGQCPSPSWRGFAGHVLSQLSPMSVPFILLLLGDSGNPATSVTAQQLVGARNCVVSHFTRAGHKVSFQTPRTMPWRRPTMVDIVLKTLLSVACVERRPLL